MIRNSARRLVTHALLPALVGGLVATAVVSAHGGDAKLVHACITKTTGAVQITADPTPYGNPSTKCRRTEHALDWRPFTKFIRTASQSSLKDASSIIKTVNCPANMVATGGGGEIVGNALNKTIWRSRPNIGGSGPPTGWYVRGRAWGNHPAWRIKAWVVCAG